MPRVLELFKGTGSIGSAFDRIGWEVVSVDIVAKFCPIHVADVATSDYKQYAPDYFDFVWGSPLALSSAWRKHAVNEILRLQQNLLRRH